MSKIVVTVKALIPVIQYGNIALEASIETELENDDLLDRNAALSIELSNLKREVANTVLPLVESEVERCTSALLKEPNPDNWMRRNSTVYQWFRISNPDVEIPAMTAILASKEVPNRINGGLDMDTPKGKLQGQGKYTQEFPFGDDTSMK